MKNKIELDEQMQVAKKLLSDPLWRLNNLYYIINRNGQRVKFKLNWAQNELYKNMWYLNVILKARQLGFSTFVGILFLDRCLFNSNISAGIIAHTREDAEKLFRRIKYAYDNLPTEIVQARESTIESARELKFNNNSILSVGTSMRSSTLQYLHVSEFGYICAHYPEKATEIVTGSFNTVAAGQYIFVESTAEGSAGHFYDLCQNAIKKQEEKLCLTQLDFKFHFYPWWKEPDYVLHQYVEPKSALKEYFNKLESEGINLSGAQIAWYCKKYEILDDNILKEFPSTVKESFQGSASGLFYGKCLVDARMEKRIGRVPYDPHALVHVAYDLGWGDYTALWFFQLIGKEIHVIDFYQDNGKSLAEYIHEVKKKPYTYGTHLVPLDANVHEYSNGASRIQVAKELGLNFTVIHAPKEKRLTVIEGIDAVKAIFPRLWIDEGKCSEGIRMLENYRKEWDERMCKWSDKAVHDYASHASDAFRYLAVGLPKITGNTGSSEDDAKALRAYWG